MKGNIDPDLDFTNYMKRQPRDTSTYNYNFEQYKNYTDTLEKAKV